MILLKNRTVPEDGYATALAEFSPVFIPLLDHVHRDHAGICSFLCSEPFVSVPAFIITSQRAVECLRACVEQLAPAAAAVVRAKPVFVVGPATETVMQDAGFTCIYGASCGNGAALADLIIAHPVYAAAPRRVVFFTGKTRRDILPTKLAASGFHVTEHVLYETLAMQGSVEIFKQASAGAAWVVFFSPQGTEEIVQHLQTHPGRFRLAAIGPTTKAYLEQAGLGVHATADVPTPNGLLLTLSSCHAVQDCLEPGGPA